MNRRRSVVLSALLVTALSAAVVAQQPASAPDPAAGVSPLTPIGSGPYRAVMEMDTRLATHTLYHPAALKAAGKLPIVAWGNGACVNAGNSFRWFLSDIASYGYLIIALGPIDAGLKPFPPGGMAPIPAAPALSAMPKLPPAATHTAQLIEALDWAIAENTRRDSPFYQRLDTRGIAVMGQSCGGAQAIEASADPRVRTTIIWNSGLFPGETTMGGGKALQREDLKLLHAPIAYISGDEEDVAFVNANADYDYIRTVPILRAYGRGILHGGTYRERNGGEFAGIGVAWLNWQLKGDARASKLFVGADCGLCVNPHWVVRSRNLH